jgi:hypothetical protein
MTSPGFSAETSLYQTSVHYRSTAASVQVDGIMPQLFPFCGPCHLNTAGACVRDCTFCEPFPPHCFTFTRPCSPSACSDSCTSQCPQCNRLVGCARLACCCRCLGGFLSPNPTSPCHFRCILT